MKLKRHNNTNWTIHLTDEEIKTLYKEHQYTDQSDPFGTHIKAQLAEFDTSITHWLAGMEE